MFNVTLVKNLVLGNSDDPQFFMVADLPFPPTVGIHLHFAGAHFYQQKCIGA